MFSTIRNLFNPKPPPTLSVPSLPERLRPYVTPFGSRVWGGATETSDLDLLISNNNYQEVREVLDTYLIDYTHTNVAYSMMISKLTFIYEGIKLELSFTDQPSLFTAVEITGAFLKTRNPTEYCDRNFRVRVFESLVGLLKHGKISDYKSDLFTFVKQHYPEICV